MRQQIQEVSGASARVAQDEDWRRVDVRLADPLAIENLAVGQEAESADFDPVLYPMQSDSPPTCSTRASTLLRQAISVRKSTRKP